ncbi:MAG TPA: lysophospholipid acyltransferase family protein [Myxococcota bacterium]|nr:lysophospholipid acyltransferase family protein [Myxococcota bacterium]
MTSRFLRRGFTRTPRRGPSFLRDRSEPAPPKETCIMGLLGTARVTLRLFTLAVLTGFTVLRLKLSAKLRGACPKTATRHGHAWARRMLSLLGVRVEVEGAPPGDAVLFVANHRSYVDIAALLAQRPCAFLAKAEIAGWPLFGVAARETHTVFVQREDKASRRAARGGALSLLKQGVAFAAFPEGTTSRGPGTLPFFPGLFELAAEHRIPVVPVAIEYAEREDAWVGDDGFIPHFLNCFRKRRMHIALAFGPVLQGDDKEGLRTEAEAWIRDRLEALAPRGALIRGGLPRTSGRAAAPTPA